MLAYIKGKVADIDENNLIIDYNGIGFSIMTSSSIIGKISIGDEVKIYTYMNVKEDDISLFGFMSKDELNVFKLLINISGIGPKGALSILSVLSIDELRTAVLSEDYKVIAKANGIGTKTAQRVIIDLKDKFRLEDCISFEADQYLQNEKTDVITETAMALTTLGYSNVEALRALKKVEHANDMTVEQLIKEALKKLI